MNAKTDETQALAATQEMDQASTSAATKMATWVGSLGTIATVVITLINLAIARGIVKPMRQGIEFAEKMAGGDLTKQVDLDQEDEFGARVHRHA